MSLRIIFTVVITINGRIPDLFAEQIIRVRDEVSSQPRIKKPVRSDFRITLPKGYKIHGIDVSKHQKRIDWNSVSCMRSGNDSITFVYIKATEGRTWRDPCFRHNWAEARKNNLIRGAYHFYRGHLTGEEQARHYCSLVRLEKEDLAQVLDIEEVESRGNRQLVAGIKVWLKNVEKHCGMKPIIYTFYNFYKTYLKDDRELKKYPLWIANNYHEKIPPGTTWMIWQHSDKGHVDGIVKLVDFNVFNGGMKEFNETRKK